MRRSGLGRALAVVYALWLVVVLSAPASLHQCAVHDGPTGSGHVHAQPAAVSHHMGAHSTHGHDNTPPCSCVAACCCAPIAVASLGADYLSLGAVTTHEHVALSPRTDRRPAAVEYARPPSIGPPALTT